MDKLIITNFHWENLHKVNSSNNKSGKETNPWVLLIGLATILLSLYFLTYNGKFITDDEQFFASRALSQAFDRQVNDARMMGNTRIFEYSHLEPQWALPATNIEPLLVITGSLMVRIAETLHFGHVQFLFIINILITILTACVLFLCIQILGYSQKFAFWTSLLFGTATMVWPFSRTLFRDPLAMFFSCLAWFFFLKINSEIRQGKKLVFLFGLIALFFVFLTFGVVSKNTVLLLLPVCGIAFLVNMFSTWKINSKQVNHSYLILGIIGLSIGASALIALQILSLKNTEFSRFSFSYYSDILHNIVTTSHPHFLQAFIGSFISPGKSIFFYSPILIFSFFGLFLHPKKTWPYWLFTILLVSAQALIYDADWWGHINWGLRFILPALPMLVLTGLPVISSLANQIKGRLILAIVCIISISVQLMGNLAPVKQYYIDMALSNPPITPVQMLWEMRYSPILWHFNWLFSGRTLDLAILRIGLNGIYFIIFFVSIVFISFWVIIKTANGKIICVSLFLTILVSMLFLVNLKYDPISKPSRSDQVIESLIGIIWQPSDLVLINPYGSSTWDYWMNWSKPKISWESLPYYFPSPGDFEKFVKGGDPNLALDINSKTILYEAMSTNKRVFLVDGADAPQMSSKLFSAWLSSKSGSVKKWFVAGDNGISALYLFSVFSSP